MGNLFHQFEGGNMAYAAQGLEPNLLDKQRTIVVFFASFYIRCKHSGQGT